MAANENTSLNRTEANVEALQLFHFGSEPFSLKQLLVDQDLLRPRLDEKKDAPNRFEVVDHLTTYLMDIGAKTVVVERDYIDRDYLDDYTRYYARCFEDYPRKCHRLHFFSEDYKSGWIGRMIATPDSEDEKNKNVAQQFEKSYLGFIVIRPLPTAIIGRTCLAVYRDRDCRHYKALVDVKISFFGRTLRVKCMPFMQQDSAAAACATCALWSSFQITAQFFGHQHYFPGCITEMGMEHGLSESRCFPNKGLSIKDMVHAIRCVGLDPLCRDNPTAKIDETYIQDVIKRVENEDDRRILQEVINGIQIADNVQSDKLVDDLKGEDAKELIRLIQSKEDDLSVWLGCLYAYLGSGLPVILVGVFRDGSAKDAHAVAVNGYCLRAEGNFGNAMNWLTSSRIEKIYAHDDQVCPGARMTLEENGIDWKTEWKCKNSAGMQHDRVFISRNLIVPAYHKIRMSYETIYDLIKRMKRTVVALRKIAEESSRPSEDDSLLVLYKFAKGEWIPEWDVRLQKCGDFKEELRNETAEILGAAKIDFLTQGYPKYLWNVCVSLQGRKVARFIVDATDCAQGLHVIKAIRYSHEMDELWKYFWGYSCDENMGIGQLLESLGYSLS